MKCDALEKETRDYEEDDFEEDEASSLTRAISRIIKGMREIGVPRNVTGFD